MAIKKNNISLYFYIFVAVNFVPLIAVAAGFAEMGQIAFVYWGECALLALGAVIMFARYLIVFFVLSCAMAIIVYMANPNFAQIKDIIITFWAFYTVCWVGYIEAVKSPLGRAYRYLTPKKRLGIYFLIMASFICACFVLTMLFASSWQEMSSIRWPFYNVILAVTILVPSISIGLNKIIEMIGQNHFVDYMLGTYLVPQEKHSVVLFLDMVGSSGMAEKLKAEKSMRLVAQFIYDCSFIFRMHGGDILNYTGDGLVVLWPQTLTEKSVKAAQALRAHFSDKSVRLGYWKRYGIVPEFRMGLHAGSVLISQIGEEKLFLGLYGDVVNTASRLEQLNKTLGTQVLLSETVIQGLHKGWKAYLKPYGAQEIRGREEKIKVYALYADENKEEPSEIEKKSVARGTIKKKNRHAAMAAKIKE